MAEKSANISKQKAGLEGPRQGTKVMSEESLSFVCPENCKSLFIFLGLFLNVPDFPGFLGGSSFGGATLVALDGGANAEPQLPAPITL